MDVEVLKPVIAAQRNAKKETKKVFWSSNRTLLMPPNLTLKWRFNNIRMLLNILKHRCKDGFHESNLSNSCSQQIVFSKRKKEESCETKLVEIITNARLCLLCSLKNH